MIGEVRVLLLLALFLCMGYLFWSQSLTKTMKWEKEVGNNTAANSPVTPLPASLPPSLPPSPPPSLPPPLIVKDQLLVPFLPAAAPDSKKPLLYDVVSVTSGTLGMSAKFAVMKTDYYVGRQIASGRWWEEHQIAVILRTFDKQPPEKCNILDLGVNLGTHTVAYGLHLLKNAERYPKTCTVFGFEPQPGVFLAASANVALNGLGNVQIFNAATVHADGQTVTMGSKEDTGAQVDFSQAARPVNFGGVSLGTGGVSAKGLRIDSLGFERVGLIKADIQGSEPMAFYGARELIKRDRPVIFFETGFANPEAMKTIVDAIKPGPVPKEASSFDLWAFCQTLNYTMTPYGEDRLLIPQ